MGSDHLLDVTDGGAEGEDAGANHRHKAAVKAGERGDEARYREAEARRADLELKGAVFPADERGRHLAEKHVEDEIDEKHDTDIE